MKTWNIIVYCFAVGAFAGCEHETAPSPLPAREHPLYFAAGIAGATSEGPATRAWVDSHNNFAKMDSVRNSLLKNKFKEGDVIRICNTQSSTGAPSFNMDGSSYVYQYVWQNRISVNGTPEGSAEEDSLVWKNPEVYSQYVFAPDAVTETDGSTYGFYVNDLLVDNNNYFQLYAMWWKEFRSGNTDSIPEIKRNQSTKEGFLNSDMMLAYRQHSINMPYDTIRFTFWHVFAMLDVRISLPAYDASTGEGDDSGKLPSGYEPEDVKMYMTNIPIDYQIVHTAGLSSHNRLGILPDVNVRVDTIPMYRYYTGEPLKEKDSEDAESSSDYRTYGFCGILPAVNWTDESLLQSLPMLRLKLKDPLSGEPKYYTYTPAPKNEEEDKPSLNLEGGHISVVLLGLPRTEGEMEVVRGFIQPWTDAETTVKVKKE